MFDYYINQLKSMLYVLPVILIAISFHEFAHGYVSFKLGDSTPKKDGRLTLNPFKHLDLMGTLCLLFFHMGWAKPVRINVARYKNKKMGTILVSLAGPLMNFFLAFLSVLIYGLLAKYGSQNSQAAAIAQMLAYYSSVINVGLGMFNLIPIPPLDGSHVLGEIWSGVNRLYQRLRPYWMVILLILLATGILSRPLGYANNALIQGMWKMVQVLLGLGIPGAGVGGTI